MAKSKVDVCMFCGKVPCACDAKPAKKKAAPKAAKPSVDPDMARMRERAARRASRPAKPTVALPAPVTHTPETLEAARVVRVLAEAGMLSAEDRERNRELYDIAYAIPPELKARISQWRIEVKPDGQNRQRPA